VCFLSSNFRSRSGREYLLRLIIRPYLYVKHDGTSSYVLVEISNPFDIYTISSGYPNQDTNDAGATFFWEIDVRDPHPGVLPAGNSLDWDPTTPLLSSEQVQFNEGQLRRSREQQAWLSAPHPQRANQIGGHHKVTLTPSTLENDIYTEHPAM
jgi:hypothetical protein